jgi:hypothetical protein
MALFFFNQKISVDKDVGKLESLLTVGKNAKWHGHYGKQHESFKNSKKRNSM